MSQHGCELKLLGSETLEVWAEGMARAHNAQDGAFWTTCLYTEKRSELSLPRPHSSLKCSYASFRWARSGVQDKVPGRDAEAYRSLFLQATLHYELNRDLDPRPSYYVSHREVCFFAPSCGIASPNSASSACRPKPCGTEALPHNVAP